MVYTKQSWVNNDPTKPLSATRLNKLETQYDEAISQVATDVANDASAIGGALSTKIDAALAGISGGVGGTPKVGAALLGNSLDNQNGKGANTLNPATSDEALRGRGWFHWANGYLGNALTLVKNAGVGGDRLDNYIARWNSDIVPILDQVGIIFIGDPQNDIAQGRTAALIIADYITLIGLATAAGKLCVLRGKPPATTDDTVGERAVLAEVNAWLAKVPATYPNVLVVNPWGVLANRSTGLPATGMTADGTYAAPNATQIHWSDAGAARVGKLYADALCDRIPAPVPVYSSPVDPASFIADPTFDTGATSWTPTSGVTATYEDDTESFGKVAVLTPTGTSQNGGHIECASLLSSGLFAIGDVVQVTARIKWSGITLGTGNPVQTKPYVRLRKQNSSNVLIDVESVWGLTASTEMRPPTGFPSSGEMVVTTAMLEVSSATNRILVAAGFAGITAGRVEIRDLAARRVAVASTTTPPVITTTTLSGLTQGAAFSQTLAATGSTPITWAVTAGALPAGLALNTSTGAITGTPTASGAYSFTVTATNANGSDPQAYSGTIAAAAGVTGLNLSTSGSYARRVTPTDMAPLQSISLRKFFLVPSGFLTTAQTFDIVRNAADTGTKFSWDITNAGVLRAQFNNASGGATVQATATAAVGSVSTGGLLGLRVDINVGTGLHRFYRSDDNGGTWTQIGADVGTAVGAVETTASSIRVSGPDGYVKRTEVRDGSGTPVLFRDWTVTSGDDSNWTLVGGATVLTS